MVNKTIETGVDDLIKLVKEKKKITIVDTAKALKLPLLTIQKWVDFLVEEKILGIEYKFTVPHIYLNKEDSVFSKQRAEELKLDLQNYKESFYRRAQANNIPADKIVELWKNHLTNELEFKKQFFINEAKKRNFKDVEIDMMWDDYKQLLTST
jgi:hypothetical protein